MDKIYCKMVKTEVITLKISAEMYSFQKHFVVVKKCSSPHPDVFPFLKKIYFAHINVCVHHHQTKMYQFTR